MRYKLQMMNTDFGVGMFAALPEANLTFNQKIGHLREQPYDDYMHEFVLQGFNEFRTRKLEKLIKEVMKDKGQSDPILTAILYEACICHSRQSHLLSLFEGLDPVTLIDHTPAIHIQSSLLEDQHLHQKWIKFFGNNIFSMEPLTPPDEVSLTPIFSEQDLDLPKAITVAESLEALKEQLPPANPRRPLKETTEYALKVLGKADVFLGPRSEERRVGKEG